MKIKKKKKIVDFFKSTLDYLSHFIIIRFVIFSRKIFFVRRIIVVSNVECNSIARYNRN